jgi:GDPmannose 4,6-dehydratase
LVELAFARAGLDWQRYVASDPRYFRPAEVGALEGDPSKAREQLGWRIRTRFEDSSRSWSTATSAPWNHELAGKLVRVDRD